jgi:hypothetical protein
MRLLTTNLLAVALLLFGAASASAYATTLSSSYDGTQIASDSITVSVDFDTEGGTDVMSLSVGVIFNTENLQQTGFTQPTYLLYTPTQGSGMAAIPANGLYPNAAATGTWGGTNPAPPLSKFNIAWTCSNFPSGGCDAAGGGNLGVLTFHIISTATTSNIDLQVSGDGNTLEGTGGSANILPNTVSGAPIVITPEPSTALLIGLGLVGLGVAGRKS